jgi:hypothetical protein
VKNKVHKTAMNGCRKSDSPVIPAKPLNKVEESAAEAVEGRGLTEVKAEQQNTSRTQSRINDVPNELDRIRRAAIRNKDEKFTALLHHITNKTRSARRLARAFLALRVQGIYPALDQRVSALRAATPWTPKTQGVRSKLRSI